jgi:hypothetical protein
MCIIHILGLLVKSGAGSATSMPCSDATFHAIDWSPRAILLPVLLAVSAGRAARGYLIEEYLRSLGFFRIAAGEK